MCATTLVRATIKEKDGDMDVNTIVCAMMVALVATHVQMCKFWLQLVIGAQ